MKTRILLLLMVCTSLLGHSSYAWQSAMGGITGKVRDQNDAPVPFAHVTVAGSASGSVTDKNGHFLIPDLPPGEHTVIVSCIGYETRQVEVAVAHSRTTIDPIRLKEKPRELDGVVVTATRSKRNLDDLAVPMMVIPKKQLSLMGSVRLDDALAEQTGLTIVHNHGTGVQLQGLDPEYTLLLIDGEPLIGRTAGTLDLNRIAIGNIKQIEVVKGPGSSLYGSEALAGVINIITEKPAGITGSVSGRYGTNNTSDFNVNTSYQRNKFGLSIFTNRYNTDGYDLAPESFGKTVNPYHSYTFNVKTNYEPSSATRLSLQGRYFIENQENRFQINSGSSPAIISGSGNVTDWNVNPVISHRFSSHLKTTFRLYGTHYGTESTLNYEQDGNHYEENYFTQTFYRSELQAEYFVNKHHILTLGGGTMRETVKASRYDSKKQFNANYLYLQYEWAPLEKLAITAGGRFDRHSAYKSQLSPKLALKYQTLPWLTLLASVGVGFKAPDFRQLHLNFTNAVAGYSVFGTEEVAAGIARLQTTGQISEILMEPSQFGELKAESSVAYNFGIRLKPATDATSTINLFRNNIHDLIQTQVVATKTNGQSVFSYFNLKEVFTQGLEANIDYAPSSSINLALGYQYLIAKDRSITHRLKRGEVYARDPKTKATYRVSADQYGGLFNRSRHMLNAKMFYDHPDKGWSGSLRVNYRGRYGFGDKNGNTILDADNEYVKGHATVNISAGKEINNFLRIRIGCDNLLDYTDAPMITALPGRLLWGSLEFNIRQQSKNN